MRFVLLLIGASLYAGQSLTTLASANIPQLSTTAEHRIEASFANWSSSGTGYPVRVGAAAENCYLSSGSFICTANQVNSTGDMIISLAGQPSTRIDMRYQFCPLGLPGGAATPTISIELWNVNGVRIGVQTRSYTTVTTANWSTGASFNNSGFAAGAVAYARIHNNCLPLNSRTPTTVDDANRLYEWKFDGNLNAAFGGINATGGTPGYLNPTPDQFAYSVPKARPTAFSNSTALRAGTFETLTGSDSYSQADASNTVTCQWNVVSTAGIAQPTFSDPNVCNAFTFVPQFGQYTYRLEVTDAAGQKAAATLELGGVAMSLAGVVVPPSPELEALVGPQIALGRNPWGYADDTHLRALTVRTPVYQAASPPEWEVNRTGSVSYPTPINNVKGRLATGGITPTSTIIELVASPPHTIDISTFPTIIYVGGTPGYGGEMIEICGIDGGNTNRLVVCFAGRSYNGNPVAGTYAANTAVYQNKASGLGTSFLSVMCPVGPGLTGTAVYSTGTITPNAVGDNLFTGGSTVWNIANGVVAGRWMRIAGTHSGGTPFVWFAEIDFVFSTTSIRLKKTWPTGGDISSFTYTVMDTGTRNFAPQWERPDGSTGRTVYASTGYCASDTALYFAGGLEAITGTQSGKAWSYMTQFWMTSAGNGTINFYDEVYANYRGWLRSGLESFRTAARLIGDYWLKQPLLDEGWGNPFPRNVSLLGPVTAAVGDSRADNWYGIRKLASQGVTAIGDDCNANTRENGYEMMWLAFAANYDPDLVQRATWRSHIQAMYDRDNSCRTATNSFAQGSEWAIAGKRGPFTVSGTTVTGTGFTAADCRNTSNGTASIVNGAGSMTVLTGSVVAAQTKILLTGTRAGQPFEVYAQYGGSGTGTITLSLDWPGDTGTIGWQTEHNTGTLSNGGNWTMWKNGNTVSEADQPVLYGCRYVSPTQLELTRTWQGAPTNVYFVAGFVPGWLQQPFIAGIKVLQMKFAAQAVAATNPSLSADYLALAGALATWIRTDGYDPLNKGLYYFRVLAPCEPPLSPGDFTNSTGQIIPACSYMPTNYNGSRGLNAEVQTALRIWYEQNPNPTNLALGDDFYAASWGFRLVSPGFTSDTNWDNAYAADNELVDGKWYGFQFGVGGADQWPAARVGGIPAESLVTRTLRYTNAPAGTTLTEMNVIRPNGTTTTWTCASGACTGTIDTRMGNGFMYQLRHSGASGLLVASPYLPLTVQ